MDTKLGERENVSGRQELEAKNSELEKQVRELKGVAVAAMIGTIAATISTINSYFSAAKSNDMSRELLEESKVGQKTVVGLQERVEGILERTNKNAGELLESSTKRCSVIGQMSDKILKSNLSNDSKYELFTLASRSCSEAIKICNNFPDLKCTEKDIEDYNKLREKLEKDIRKPTFL